MRTYNILERYSTKRRIGDIGVVSFSRVYGLADEDIIGDIEARDAVQALLGYVGFEVSDGVMEVGIGDRSLYVFEGYQGNRLGETLIQLSLETAKIAAERTGRKFNTTDAFIKKGDERMRHILEKLCFQRVEEHRKKVEVYRMYFE
ncbi:MAG: hypothetical protein HY513_01960 [Candidatus Aenigmarchaeota archaeon]|nr:hypothetical protein [Candidatus Aenigmarchaeota archaeon]